MNFEKSAKVLFHFYQGFTVHFSIPNWNSLCSLWKFQFSIWILFLCFNCTKLILMNKKVWKSIEKYGKVWCFSYFRFALFQFHFNFISISFQFHFNLSQLISWSNRIYFKHKKGSKLMYFDNVRWFVLILLVWSDQIV